MFINTLTSKLLRQATETSEGLGKVSRSDITARPSHYAASPTFMHIHSRCRVVNMQTILTQPRGNICRKPWLIENYLDTMLRNPDFGPGSVIAFGDFDGAFVRLSSQNSLINVSNCIMARLNGEFTDIMLTIQQRGLSHTKESEMKIIRLRMRHSNINQLRQRRKSPLFRRNNKSKPKRHPIWSQISYSCLDCYYCSYFIFRSAFCPSSLTCLSKSIWRKYDGEELSDSGSFILSDSHLENWN